jgi:hypothetical protein
MVDLSILKVEKVDSPETSVRFYQIAQCHTTQDINLDSDRLNCIMFLKRSFFGAETFLPFLKHVSHLYIKF